MAPLEHAEIEERLANSAGWALSEDGGSIEREWKFENFARAMEFVNAVGEVAEGANHHPDILLHGWNHVRLTLSTHSQGGLTDADFQLAGEVDRLV